MSMRHLLPMLASLGLALASSAARAEEPAHSLSLGEAVTEALASHPRITSSVADEAAAEARIDEARAARLPDVGVSAQLNRSTANTVPGAFFSTTGFVPIAGPTRTKSLDEGVWQSGASLWASWDVLSLARQAAAIDVAIAGRSEASAATSARRLELAYRAADAYLLLLEAQETVRAAHANVERAEVLAGVTKSLVDQSLRPGADAARADAEVAGARTSLARAEQGREVRRVQLAETVGSPTRRIDATPGGLLASVDGVASGGAAAPSRSHPDIVVGDAAVVRATEAKRLVDVAYLPRLDLVAALWARGSGIFASPASGLVPDTANWAAGATLTWSFLDIQTLRTRARVASATRDAAVARRDELSLAVAGQLATSDAIVRGSLGVARETPKALAAARAAEQQASARFKTGLTPVVDVADAQRVLTQAEIDDVIARLEVRRALLLLGRASGDLEPFFAQARAGQGR